MPYNQSINESPYGSTTALLRNNAHNNRISTDGESLYSEYEEKGYPETISSVDEKHQYLEFEKAGTGGENRPSTVINWNWCNTQYSKHQDVFGQLRPQHPPSGTGFRKILGKPDERTQSRLVPLKDLFQAVSDLEDLEKQDKNDNNHNAFFRRPVQNVEVLIDELYSQIANTLSAKLRPTFRDMLTSHLDPERDSVSSYNSTCRNFNHDERKDRNYTYQNSKSPLWLQDRRDNHNYHNPGPTSRISCIIKTFHNAHIMNSVRQSIDNNFSIRKLPSQSKRIEFDQNQTRGTVQVEERTNCTDKDAGGLLLTLTTNVDDKDSVCSTRMEVDWNLDARILGDDDRVWEI